MTSTLIKKKFINEENEVIKISKDQIKNTSQTKPVLSFSDQKISAKNIDTKKVLTFDVREKNID